MTSDMTHLSDVASDLRRSLNVLPGVDVETPYRDQMEQSRVLRAATARLGHYLTATYGARITEKPGVHHRVRMCGITSTGTGGLEAALRNWLAAADRRLG